MPRHAFLLLALSAIAASPAALGSGGSPDGHPSWSFESCLACHRTEEAPSIAGRVARPCRAHCASCHDFRGGHHTVGVPVPAQLPAPMTLTAAGAITCVTCHDTTRPAVDDVPWASESLFERVVRRRGKSRTFYLAMRNEKGQLCRACH